MAYAVELTVCIGSDVLSEANAPKVCVSLTYRLERADTHVLKIVTAKVAEAVRAYQLAILQVRETKMSDGEETLDGAQVSEAEPDEPLSPAQESALRALLSRDNRSEDGISQEMKSRFGATAFEQLTERQATCWLLELQRAERQRAQVNPQSNGRSH